MQNRYVISVNPTYVAAYDSDDERGDIVIRPVVAAGIAGNEGIALVFNRDGGLVRCNDEGLPGQFRHVRPADWTE